MMKMFYIENQASARHDLAEKNSHQPRRILGPLLTQPPGQNPAYIEYVIFSQLLTVAAQNVGNERESPILSRDSDGAVRSNENKILVTMRITVYAPAGQDNTKKTSWFQNIANFLSIYVR
jgi:hypothetical protein